MLKITIVPGWARNVSCVPGIFFSDVLLLMMPLLYLFNTGLPDVPFLPALPRVRHAPGGLRRRGMYPRPHLCIQQSTCDRALVSFPQQTKTPAEQHYPAQNEFTPVHMLLLSFAGCAFALVIGSFLGYHIYLVLCVLPHLKKKNHCLTNKNSTNQTTLEHISPFYILRHLPPFPPCGRLSSPPLEHQLASAQRRAVRAVHAQMHLYDVGWRRNAAQVFGVGGGGGIMMKQHHNRWHRWAARLLWGGSWYVCLVTLFDIYD
jgi:hypothetical protein